MRLVHTRIFLSIWLGCLLPLLCTASEVYDKALPAWTQGNLSAVQSIKWGEYRACTSTELQTLWPQMAKWLPMQEVLAEHPNESWMTSLSGDEWTNRFNALPPEGNVRKQYSMGIQAAEVIHSLSKQRLLNDQAVLSFLVEGLETPGYYTSNDCFNTLGLLTKLYDGSLTPLEYLSSKEEHQRLVNWYRGWLKANGSKQLMVTAAWEDKLRNRFIVFCQHIEALSAKEGHFLHGFKVPDKKLYHQVDEPLFFKVWRGESLATFSRSPRGEGWLYACVRTQTPLLHDIKGWERYAWDVPAKLPKDVNLVYREPLLGTDWALEIYAKKVPTDELNELIEVLQKESAADNAASVFLAE